MFKIEKNVPIPTNMIRKRKYPFEELKIGDSFFVPSQNLKPSSLFSAMSQARKRLNINLVSVSVNGGRRVWRIAQKD